MGLNQYTYEGLADIAAATNLSISYISRIFSGHRKPSLGAAERIAEHLGMSVDRFCAELKAGEPFPPRSKGPGNG